MIKLIVSINNNSKVKNIKTRIKKVIMREISKINWKEDI